MRTESISHIPLVLESRPYTGLACSNFPLEEKDKTAPGIESLALCFFLAVYASILLVRVLFCIICRQLLH